MLLDDLKFEFLGIFSLGEVHWSLGDYIFF